MDDLTFDIGGPVHVVDHGGEGPPMLLVHGLAGSHLNWMDVAPAFTRHHHVWSLDLIGFGRTPLGDRHATIDDNRRLVDEVAARIGDGQPVLLVGNSMGGLISIVEASVRPERVAGLILVDPALPRTSGGRLTLMVAAAFLMLAVPGVGHRVVGAHARLRGAERLVDDALKLCTVDVNRIRRETRDAHVELDTWRQGQPDSQRAFVEASRSLTRWLISRRRLAPHVAAITAPTLLIHGDTDRLVALHAAASVAVARPDWDFKVLDDTGHVPMMERPEAFVRIVDGWLRERGLGGVASAQPSGAALPTSAR